MPTPRTSEMLHGTVSEGIGKGRIAKVLIPGPWGWNRAGRFW
jgi:hypothetical protein